MKRSIKSFKLLNYDLIFFCVDDDKGRLDEFLSQSKQSRKRYSNDWWGYKHGPSLKG